MILKRDEQNPLSGAIPYNDGTGWLQLPPGPAGQVLATQGSGLPPHWTAAGSGVGTVTQIIAGAGLTGGTITGSGTVGLAATGLVITQHSGAITADTDGSTITFNLATSDWHTVTLGGNRTLALSNPTVGQQFTLALVQDGTGSRAVTWFGTIQWPGGVAPTLTTTAGKADVVTFKCISTGVYYGFVAGQAL